jgi:hypothetical protein
MKKLLFVLAFAFIGQQVFSQIYIVTIAHADVASCNTAWEVTLTKTPPTGPQISTCIANTIYDGAIEQLNQELNIITSQGYKLIETSFESTGMIKNNVFLAHGAFIFAIP